MTEYDTAKSDLIGKGFVAPYLLNANAHSVVVADEAKGSVPIIISVESHSMIMWRPATNTFGPVEECNSGSATPGDSAWPLLAFNYLLTWGAKRGVHELLVLYRAKVENPLIIAQFEGVQTRPTRPTATKINHS